MKTLKATIVILLALIIATPQANAIIYIQGAFGGAGWSEAYYTDFDGVDEYLLKDSPSYGPDTKSGGRSLCLWTKIDTAITSGAYQIFRVIDDSTSTYNGFWALRIIGSAGPTMRISLQRRVENGSTFSPATVISGATTNLATATKYLICITTSGTAHNIYINTTTEISSDTNASGDWWGNALGFIGTTHATVAATYTAVGPTDGKVSEIYYFNKQINSTEVSELYNSGAEKDPSTLSFAANLDGYWRMGDGDTHPTILDNTNSDDFTMTNMESGDLVNGSL